MNGPRIVDLSRNGLTTWDLWDRVFDLPECDGINLGWNPLDDLWPLVCVPRLKVLDLTGTPIEDLAGLEFVQLEELILNKTRVNDESLRIIANMKTLRKLSVLDTAISPEGIEWLRGELPNLKVVT